MRRPPRSTHTYTLFPDSSLFRSEPRPRHAEGGARSAVAREARSAARRPGAAVHLLLDDRPVPAGLYQPHGKLGGRRPGLDPGRRRSEEQHVLTTVTNAHTVCRLLLETYNKILRQQTLAHLK